MAISCCFFLVRFKPNNFGYFKEFSLNMGLVICKVKIRQNIHEFLNTTSILNTYIIALK